VKQWYHCLEKSVSPHDLVNIAKNTLLGSSYYLILDDKIIEKIHSRWKNIDFYVTSAKRTTKTGRNIVVYQASKFKAFAKKQV
jgi:hypothetical protein